MRLSLDLGYESIGWCLFDLDKRSNKPCKVINLGGLIYNVGRDQKSKKSNASIRTEYKQTRRQKARTKWRKERLVRNLISMRLLPKHKHKRMQLNNIDPYELRLRAIDKNKSLTPYEFGRLLIHLNQRRGFKSNRKSVGDEDGPIKSGITSLERTLSDNGYRTLGEFLALKHRKQEPIKIRSHKQKNQKTKHYEIFFSRKMVEDEYNLIWEYQKKSLNLTQEMRDKLFHCIFHQRPLKPVDPGRCSYETNEFRHKKSSILFQKFRILSELSNLTIIDETTSRPLDIKEREILYSALRRQKELSFDKMRKLLELEKTVPFNLESNNKKSIKGCHVSAALSSDKGFGKKRWESFSDDQKDIIASQITHEEDEDNLCQWLVAETNVSYEKAEAISAIPLPSGYGRFSEKLLKKIVPVMEGKTLFDESIGYDRYYRLEEALCYCGYHTNKKPTKTLNELPYYGELLPHRVGVGSDNLEDSPEVQFGKVANPTIHIAMNQLRKLVNDIIARYGRPSEIVIEMSREINMGAEQLKKHEAATAQNYKKNNLIKKILRENNIHASQSAIKRYKLWEELNPKNEKERICVYSGLPITFEDAMSGIQTEVDHIIPRSRSLDNSLHNLILCKRNANQGKGNKTPYEAWGNNNDLWNSIKIRSANLPERKKKRILISSKSELKIDDELPHRLLNDTRYVATMAREYLSHIVASESKIWCTNGYMTSILRNAWRLDDILGKGKKNRLDHRHHAIDAVVIGLTDKDIIKKASQVAKSFEDDTIKKQEDSYFAISKTFANLEYPWNGFYNEVEENILNIVVYHKPDHGVDGELVKGSHYRVINSESPAKQVSIRKTIDSLTLKDIDLIKDEKIREECKKIKDRVLNQNASADKKAKESEIAKHIINNPKLAHIRRVRVNVNTNTIITVGPENGRRNVEVGFNHRIEVWSDRSGNKKVFCISLNDAAKNNGIKPNKERDGFIPHKKLLTLHKNDLCQYTDPKSGRSKVVRIVRLNPDGNRVCAVEHFEAGSFDKRQKDKNDPFKWTMISFTNLTKGCCKKLWMRPTGLVK